MSETNRPHSTIPARALTLEEQMDSVSSDVAELKRIQHKQGQQIDLVLLAMRAMLVQHDADTKISTLIGQIDAVLDMHARDTERRLQLARPI